MKKRVVSWLLVVLMLTSLLPTSVLAEMAEGAAQTPAAEEVLPETPEAPESPEEPEQPEQPVTPETPEEPENTEDAGQETGPLAAVQNAAVAVQAGVTEISSAAEFAEILRLRFKELTVITHSLDVFERLQGKSGFKILLVGGTFLPEEKAFCGITALETYKMLHCDKAFIMPAAVSLKNGITDCGETLMTVERQMLDSADEVFVLADSDKFEKTALYRLAPMSARFTLVTDSGLSEELRALYEENGIRVAGGESSDG